MVGADVKRNTPGAQRDPKEPRDAPKSEKPKMMIRMLEKCCETRRDVRPDITLTAAVLAVGTICGLIGLAEAMTAAFIQYIN